VSGEFEQDKLWMQGVRERFLRPFYERHTVSFEFVDGDVDTIIVSRKTGNQLGVEEKLIRPPRVLEAFGNYLLETMSNTNLGHERDGWMVTSPADLLLYGFCGRAELTMDVHILDMPALKAWFRPRCDMFESYVTEQFNHTRVSKVPFGIVPREIRLHRTLLFAPDYVPPGEDWF
jgi:hypothetical protein